MAAEEAGTTVNVSLPSGVPERDMPNVYTLPLAEILLGVALDIVAVPPLMDNEISLASKDPLSPLVLYTASLMVTAMVLLFDAKDTEDIVGRTPSTPWPE